MTVLNLPSFDYKIKKENDKIYIFDTLRKRYVRLTPEEWVRQHFVAFLIYHKAYPQGLMGNEISLSQNGRTRRCDTVVYDMYSRPTVIVEYKAPSIPLTQDTFDQIARYNMVLKVNYLMVSNGISHYCCAIDYAQNTYRFLPEIPPYTEL